LEKSQQKQAVAKVTKGGKNIKDAIKDVKPPEPVKGPERNEHGALIALPEKVTMRMVKIKPEHMYKNEDNEYKCLLCDINVDSTRREKCYVFPLENENNFMFRLPNVKNLVIDFSDIFKIMTPIFSYRQVEEENLEFTRIFPIKQWNDFVESRFPDLIMRVWEELTDQERAEKLKTEADEIRIRADIAQYLVDREKCIVDGIIDVNVAYTGEELVRSICQTCGRDEATTLRILEKLKELIEDGELEEQDELEDAPHQPQQKKEPETSKESNDTEQEIDRPFVLYIGKRDMGVLEIFHNHELNIALLCRAIQKIQDKTELWDNKKNKIIFTFNGEWTPEAIIETANEKINKFLDAEEHLPPDETIKQDNVLEEMVKEKPEPVKPEATQQTQPEESELVKETVKEAEIKEPVKARVRIAKKDVSHDGVSSQQVKNKKKTQQQAKPDEFHKNLIKISDNVQVALKKAKDKAEGGDILLLEEILTSNSYDVDYEFTAVNSYKLDRNLYVTDDMYNRLEALAKERGAKDLNEIIARLWQGHKKQIAEGSKKTKSPSKKKKTSIDINHQKSDDTPN
jgi:hypothetical protein